MYDLNFRKLGLSYLLENDLSSHEYFHTLPKQIQAKIENKDIASFYDMQEYVNKISKTKS